VELLRREFAFYELTLEEVTKPHSAALDTQVFYAFNGLGRIMQRLTALP
jgi:hypothetical protein